MTRIDKQAVWSDWRPLAGWNPPPAVLVETLDGGQSFRWRHAEGVWTGQWSDGLVQVRSERDALSWRGAGGTVEAHVQCYFGLRTDWVALTNSLPWRSDIHLATCIAAFPGLRILRQPFGETLLGFLCSATKQIVQIKQMCALIADRHGAVVAPGHRRLPTWTELAKISEKDLRSCLLGFRAKFIHDTARFIASRPGWLDETEQLPYPEAKARLLELPGVGEKIADCVLLFGAGRLESFPVDTWVLKSIARHYGLDGWKPAQVAHFGRTHFGPLAGLAQQYLFAWERKFGGR